MEFDYLLLTNNVCTRDPIGYNNILVYPLVIGLRGGLCNSQAWSRSGHYYTTQIGTAYRLATSWHTISNRRLSCFFSSLQPTVKSAQCLPLLPPFSSCSWQPCWPTPPPPSRGPVSVTAWRTTWGAPNRYPTHQNTLSKSLMPWRQIWGQEIERRLGPHFIAKRSSNLSITIFDNLRLMC